MEGKCRETVTHQSKPTWPPAKKFLPQSYLYGFYILRQCTSTNDFVYGQDDLCGKWEKLLQSVCSKMNWR